MFPGPGQESRGLEIVRAILEYGPRNERWQQREIVKLFKPVCYQTGERQFNTPVTGALSGTG